MVYIAHGLPAVSEDTADPPMGRLAPGAPGIVSALGELAPETLIAEDALAHILGKSRDTIKRAVARDELPPPVRMFGKPTWTAGTIVRHVEDRLADARRRALEERDRMLRYEP